MDHQKLNEYSDEDMWITLDDYPTDNHIRQRNVRRQSTINNMLMEIKQQQIGTNEKVNRLYELQVDMGKSMHQLYEVQVDMGKSIRKKLMKNK
ncbi:unnamed protein product [Rotaria socialis]|uniref:Uncharacterized protein n=1 Tax=Rotaria socialis TaxID=392032 RepID=A0A821S9R2_9BILA|nr:unnamed protein product [Rotaria socialis]CAF4855021.1 unnamed protein product [Rotaria socialis]